MADKHPSPAELHKAASTNIATRFKQFSLKLSNGATLTGIAHIPSQRDLFEYAKPLVVGVHGATCSAYTFDVSPDYTASTWSELFGVPFVAFNRPNFLDSSGWVIDRSSEDPKNPAFRGEEGESYFHTEGRWLHDYILPALWAEFGMINECSSLVTFSHSMGCPSTTIAAARHSVQPYQERNFPWAGAILYGYSEVASKHCTDSVMRPKSIDRTEVPLGQDPSIHVPPSSWEEKADLMVGPSGLEPDRKLRMLIAQGSTPFLVQEIMDMTTQWPTYKTEVKAKVSIPILYALGEYDWPWQGSKRNVDAFCREFVNAPRIEGAWVEGSSHSIELGRCGKGWWIRCFGWAMEVAASMKVREWESKPENFEQGEWDLSRGP